MNAQTNHAALRILQYWASIATGQPTIDVISGQLQDDPRQIAWLLAGQPAPEDGTWPAPRSGPLTSIFGRVNGRDDRPIPMSYLQPASLRLDQATLFPTSAGAPQQPVQ
jgi:hypothetical protein